MTIAFTVSKPLDIMFSKLKDKLTRRSDTAASLPHRTAAEKVTQTYELLEHILGYLEPRSLRQAHLVDRYWHAIIHNSSSLAARLTESDKLRRVRTLLVGGRSGVGLDSVANCLMQGLAYFPYGYDPTWSPDFGQQITVDNERWFIDGDSGGWIRDDGMSGLLGQAMANCDTCMLFYSVDSRRSFDLLISWLKQMDDPTEPLSMLVTTRREAERKRTSKYKYGRSAVEQCLISAVVSTKNDLPASQLEVDPFEGAALAQKLGCPFIETSAATGDGIQQAFVEMCRAYKRARIDQLRPQSKRSSLIKATSASKSVDAREREERKERWWRWYRAKQRRT